jgi:hypothetical protein
MLDTIKLFVKTEHRLVVTRELTKTKLSTCSVENEMLHALPTAPSTKLVSAAGREHDQVELEHGRLRLGAHDLEQGDAARHPEPAGAAHDGALEDLVAGEGVAALQGQRAAAVLAGGEHESDGREVVGVREVRAGEEALVLPDLPGRRVRPRAQHVVDHAHLAERRVVAEQGRRHGPHRGVRAREPLVHVDADALALLAAGGEGGRREEGQHGGEHQQRRRGGH